MKYNNFDVYMLMIEIDSWLMESKDAEKYFEMEMLATLVEFINCKEYRDRLTKEQWKQITVLLRQENKMRRMLLQRKEN